MAFRQLVVYYYNKVRELTREELEEKYTYEEKMLGCVWSEIEALWKAQRKSYKIKKFFYSKVGQFIFKHFCNKWLCEKVINRINDKW